MGIWDMGPYGIWGLMGYGIWGHMGYGAIWDMGPYGIWGHMGSPRSPQATSIGRSGTLQLVGRALAATTYTELCVPDDIEQRGLTGVPKYHYGADAMDIWGAIHR